MEIIKLQARERTGSGKSYTRKARAQGWIPAVYYGKGREPKNIEVPHKDFSAVVRARKHKHLFDLGLGTDTIAVICKIDRQVLKDDVYFNLDFRHINMKEKTTVDVQLELVGVPVGVKDDNGVLGHPHKTIKIECLPGDIPEKITIDVAAMKIGDSIHVRDVSFPNLTIKHAPEELLAVVAPPAREAAKPVEEAAAAAPAPAKVPAKKAPAKK